MEHFNQNTKWTAEELNILFNAFKNISTVQQLSWELLATEQSLCCCNNMTQEGLRNKTAYFLHWFFSMASVLVMRAHSKQHHHLQAWREGTEDTAMC